MEENRKYVTLGRWVILYEGELSCVVTSDAKRVTFFELQTGSVCLEVDEIGETLTFCSYSGIKITDLSRGEYLVTRCS